MAIKGYWKFNGNSNDYSGNGYNGTDNNVTYLQHLAINGAAYFNGLNAHISLGVNNLIPTTAGQNIAFSFLFNADRAQTGTKYEQCFNLKEGIGFCYDHASSSFKGAAFFCSSVNTYYSTGLKNFLQNKWTLICISYDGSYLKLWVNGVISSSVFIGSVARRASSYNNISTNFTQDATAFFSGYQDEIKLYSNGLYNAYCKNEFSRIKGFF